MHPSGKFVYSSNRGHDSIAVFEMAFGRGGGRLLTLLENTPNPGETPRNFGIDPTGRWLLTNQDSDSSWCFEMNTKTGPGRQVEVGAAGVREFPSGPAVTPVRRLERLAGEPGPR